MKFENGCLPNASDPFKLHSSNFKLPFDPQHLVGDSRRKPNFAQNRVFSGQTEIALAKIASSQLARFSSRCEREDFSGSAIVVRSRAARTDGTVWKTSARERRLAFTSPRTEEVRMTISLRKSQGRSGGQGRGQWPVRPRRGQGELTAPRATGLLAVAKPLLFKSAVPHSGRHPTAANNSVD